MIRIGIVGIGATVSIAHFHALGYLSDPRCRIAAVYDINTEGAHRFVKDHGLDAIVASSFDEMLDNVDAVSVCTPNAFHYCYASEALKKGKHVLVEKPMATSIGECSSLNNEAASACARSSIGLVYRFASPVAKARRIIEENFSKIYTVSGWFGGKRLADPSVPFEWRMDRAKSGTGAFGDFMSHLIDMASFITGCRIDTVSAFSSTFIKERSVPGGMRAVENDDATVLNARSGGTLMQFTVSRVGMDDVMMIVTGDGGMLQLSLRGNGSIVYWPKAKDGAYSGRMESIAIDGESNMEAWFKGEMPAFLDLIEGKESTAASIEEGYYVEKVIEAGARSIQSGKEERV